MKKFDYYLQNVRIQKAVAYIHDEDDVLDIGSGEGPLFQLLAEKKINFKGIGMDPEIAAEIQCPNYRILKERFPSESISNRRFNVITALAVIEHIPELGLNEFIRDCREYLMEDGMMIITVPSKWVDPILNLLIRLHIIHGMEVGQHHGYDTDLTIPFFRQNGFTLVRHQKFQLGLNNLFVFRKTSTS